MKRDRKKLELKGIPIKVKRGLEYLTNELHVNFNEKDLEFYFWKDVLKVKNPKTFHDICSALKVKELKKYNGLLFFMDIPNPGGYEDSWLVVLPTDDISEFLKKYEKDYIIRSPKTSSH